MLLVTLWPLAGGGLALLAAALLARDMLGHSRGTATMIELSRAVHQGVRTFVRREYRSLAACVGLVFLFMWLAGRMNPDSSVTWHTGLAFLLGSACAALACWLGLGAATRGNSRTADAARQGGITEALRVAIGAGSVMGLGGGGLVLLGLVAVLNLSDPTSTSAIGYALGISVVALFARAGGGIYAKGSDMGADLVSALEEALPEDDPRNPAVIADNVGDNIGDVAGLGSDLLDSFIAALVGVWALFLTLRFPDDEGAATRMMIFILALAGWCLLVSTLGVLYVRLLAKGDPQRSLVGSQNLAAVLLAIGAWALIHFLDIRYVESGVSHGGATIFWAVFAGIAAAPVLGWISVFFTSARYAPTRRIASHSRFGAALTFLEGTSVGMASCAMPTAIVALVLVVGWESAGLFGVGLSAMGLLGTSGAMIAINAYGSIADNAGGIAEMAHLDRSIREITDNLDAVGTTTAAIGKGFAVCAAALTSLVLIAAYIRTVRLDLDEVSLASPPVLAGVLLGAMFPLMFGALLLRGVGRVAYVVIEEVRRQLREIPGILEDKAKPDYSRCIDLATSGAMRGMLLPGLMGVLFPVIVGFGLGKQVLAGALVGAVVSGLIQGLQMTHAGGALDNAKNYIEDGNLGGRESDAHQAAVIGDMAGDPLKDAVGPALNVLIKMMALIALLIAKLL